MNIKPRSMPPGMGLSKGLPEEPYRTASVPSIICASPKVSSNWNRWFISYKRLSSKRSTKPPSSAMTSGTITKLAQ